MSKARIIAACLFATVGCSLALSACGAASAPFKGRDGPTDPVVPVTTPQDETCKKALTGPFEDSLPVPDQIVVEEDDNSARLQWGGGLDRAYTDAEKTTEGYRVCWGASEDKLEHSLLFTQRIGTVFNVPNDEDQVAVIQAVDMFGRVSAPSEVFSFKGSPKRVDALAAEMTGFFDDFNTASGTFDELKWNVAFSRCNDPMASYTYIGDEFHALSVLGNNSHLPGAEPGCDRDQNIARARGVFDFTDRTGRIALDLDGTTANRSTWYLDVFPLETPSDTIDITGHVTFDPGFGHPGRYLRFSQAGDLVMIHQYSVEGLPLHLLKAEISVRVPGLRLFPGQVLRHWEFKVSKNYAAIYIDGQLVLENKDIDLDFQTSSVHFAQFGYNPAKISYPWHMVHWDNFGFDGPATKGVTHNYKTSFNRSDLMWIDETTENKASWEVEIPDSLEGATGARLFYTVQTFGYQWSKDDAFTVNAETESYPMPEPRGPAGAWDDGVTGLAGEYPAFSTNVEIPVSALKTGTNSINYSALKSRVLNQHIEVYFEGDEPPKYTQPRDIVAPTLPELLPYGPSVWVNMINGAQCHADGSEFHLTLNDVEEDPWIELDQPVSKTMTVNVVVDSQRSLHMFGRNLGVAAVKLIVDGEEMAAVKTDTSVAAPEVFDGPMEWNQPHPGGIELSIDTTKLSNGMHEMEVQAFDSAGTLARMGYSWTAFFYGIHDEIFAPVRFTVAN